MAFSSQAFRAPSLTSRPKLGKTTVSSSVFRGTTKAVSASKTIKVPAGMGYGRIYRGANVDPKYLKKEGTPLEQTLVETNNILVEIQKQLSADFAYRIAKEDEETKKIRAAADKKKRIDAEKGAEGVKKVASAIGGVADKVLAPARSIIDKILGFLSAVATGFVVEKAIPWLLNNRDKIEGTFKFVQDNWKWILGIIGGVLVGRVVYKVVRLYRALRGVARFLTGRGGKPSTGGGRTRGGIFRNAAGQRRGGLTIGRETRSFYTGTGGRTGPARYNGGAARQKIDLEVVTRQKGIINKALQGVEVSAKKFSRDILKSLGMGPGAKTLQKSILKFARPILKRIPFVGALLDFALSVALGEDPGRAAFGAIGAGLLGAVGTFLGGPVGTFIGGFAGDFAGRKLYDLFFGNKSKDPNAEEAKGMNSGGTVTGRNVGDRDSVPALLTVGEKVVPREQSKASKFGPFVDDIIRDKGSLYGGMVFALREQEENNKLFKKTNVEFEKTLKELLEKNKPQPRNTGGGANISPPTESKAPSAANTIKPTGRDTSASLKKEEDSGPETIMLPMQRSGSNLPPSQAAMAPAAGGSSIPTFDAEDPENTYIEFMKMQLGIFGV
jgi:hypothetical protein